MTADNRRYHRPKRDHVNMRRSSGSRLFLFCLLIPAMLSACSMFSAKTPSKHYYLLTYAQPEAMAEGKYPIMLRVKDFSISPTYNRSQMVYRYSLHELEYYNYRLWSEKPNLMISDLVRQTIAGSGLFARVTRKLEDKAPDFTLNADIDAIEELDSDETWYAHLAIRFSLQRFGDNAVVWSHAFDERRPVLVKEPRIVVRTLSEILQQQLIIILRKLDEAMPAILDNAEPSLHEEITAPQTDKKIIEPDQLTAVDDETVPGEVTDSQFPATEQEHDDSLGDEFIKPHDSAWLDSPQMLADTTAIPTGKGAIFVPTLSHPDREPVVIIYRAGAKITTSTTGVRIPLDPGRYTLRFGSGTIEQTYSSKAIVEEQRITVIEPFWAGLDVRVVDEHFIPFRGTYEVIAIPSREEFGIGFGANEEQGEETKVWLLMPGLFKIIQAGGTYRDRTNFSTVFLQKGELTVFTLVLDQDSGDFLGAGIIEEEKGSDITKRWKFRSLIGGDVLFLNETDAARGDLQGWTFTGNIFLDTVANFRLDRHQLNLRGEIEEGQIKRPNEESRTLTDRFYFHSIYTYYLIERFGPYVRGGVETSLTNQYYYFENQEPHRVIIYETGTSRGTQFDNLDRVQIGEPFTPIQLKEGLGGNIKLFTTEYLDMDVRLGLGARQYYAHNSIANVSESDVEAVFTKVDNHTLYGVESSVVALARLTRYAGLSFEFDSLFPIDKPEDRIYSVRSTLSIRLVSFASLNYKLDILRDPNINEAHPTSIQHQFLIRFSYTLF